jgi:hypothetical protein
MSPPEFYASRKKIIRMAATSALDFYDLLIEGRGDDPQSDI